MNERGQRSSRQAAKALAEQAASWCLELADGLSPSRAAALEGWLAQSPSHRHELRQMLLLHGQLCALLIAEPTSTAELQATARQSSAVVRLPTLHRRELAMPARPRPRRHRQVRPRRWAPLALAACAVLVAGVLSPLAPADGLPATIYQGGATVQSVSLADGSLLQLDCGAVVAVRLDPRQRRIDLLRGRVLIDVGHERRPLRVHLGDHVLEDVGTVFAVQWGQQHGQLDVLSGEVRVRGGGTPSMRVRGGQRLMLGRGERAQQPQALDLAAITDWLPATVRMDHQPIATVARYFNAYTARPIVIDDAELAARPISGVFHPRDSAGFLAYLSSLPGVSVQRRADAIRVLRRRPSTGRL